MGPWFYNPHVGGRKIPVTVRERVRRRILAHAEKRYRGRYRRLEVRFSGVFCYIDAYLEPAAPRRLPKNWPETRQQMLERLRNTPTRLVRLRYFDEDRWSLAFYTYSHERYEPCVFASGSFKGTPEEALDVGSVYLD